MKKNVLKILALFLTLFSNSCYSLGNNEYEFQKNYQWNTFIDAIGNRDYETVKNSFAKNKIKDIENFDELIVSFCDNVKGYPYYKDELRGSEIGLKRNGKYQYRKIEFYNEYVYTISNIYLFSGVWMVIDNDDSDNVGIQSLHVFECRIEDFEKDDSTNYGIQIA